MSLMIVLKVRLNYVSKQKGICDDTDSKQPLDDKSCKFTVQLSRGGLVHPSKDMFDLAQYLTSPAPIESF